MGGTFDPPHNAHIAMAKAAQEQFSLDKVIFMTGGNPPHKTSDTDARIRHHMVKLAIKSYDKFFPCDYEVKKQGYSYTADTLRFLKETMPEDEIYFIIGGDSFGAIFSWFQPEEILKRCVLLVYPRGGCPSENEVEKLNERYGADARLLKAGEYCVSSTDIRRMAEEGEEIKGLLPEPVYEYIRRNNLYKKNCQSMEDHLKSLLKPSRYTHSIGVASTAVTMAGLYHADPQKAYIAGLLHDCAKNLTPEETKQKCIDLEVETDDFEKANPALLHAKVGAEFIKTEFGINDEEISSAIRWHTVGRTGMSTLEKIVFTADMIEPERIFPEADFLRKCAYEDLDLGVLECVLATIGYNEKKKKPIHPNAYAIRDELMARGVVPLSRQERS